MNIDFINLNGFGQYVWPAFIFTLVSCFTLFLKTKKELSVEEKKYFIEFEQKFSVTAPKQKEYSKKTALINPSF